MACATFGFFSGTGRAIGYRQTVEMLDSRGFRPGWFWANMLALCHFVAGPLVALGLFRRPAALLCMLMLIFVCFDRWRIGGYFANKGASNSP